MVWEEFARAAYLFLSNTEVMKIKEYVPQAINSVAYLIVAETGVPAAFMGIEVDHLEMLFISPAERSKGFGRQFIES